MTKTQFRAAIRELIEHDVNGLSLDEKIAVMRKNMECQALTLTNPCRMGD